jgi:hypothetical protein
MRNLRLVLVVAILSLAACKKAAKTEAKDKAAATETTGSKGGADPAPEKAAKDEGSPGSAAPQIGSAGQPAAGQPPAEAQAAASGSEAIQIVEKVADEMCKCTDATCAQKVVSENSAAMAKMTGFTPSTVEEGDAIMMASKRMSECASKIPM